MKRALLLAGVAALASTGCASPPRAVAERPVSKTVKVVNGSGAPWPGVARYDRSSGVCSRGAVQLMTPVRFGQMVAGWQLGVDCSDPAKRTLPEDTQYPLTNGRMRFGSAHVLVRIDTDGKVASADAVCASDASFAEAAVDTIRAIQFTPGICRGVPARAAIMLPLDFDPR